MRFLILFLLFATSLARAEDPLDVLVRPQLPSSVKTVGEAAAWYAETIGYRFYSRAPASGDARKLSYTTVRTFGDNEPPVPLREALLAIVPADVDLIIDRSNKAIAYRVDGSTP